MSLWPASTTQSWSGSLARYWTCVSMGACIFATVIPMATFVYIKKIPCKFYNRRK
ncbi:hypothetical protein GHT06_020275 [Daphnia sinensis]|uniref:Uncharacterized protein n=1 Tax=Daphnia sinensis TaxID=1820382 RepID=A0AAD5PPC2_9CRUS|nr:hypothetical protein GHT06_020275 [Daphnia sinensis]